MDPSRPGPRSAAKAPKRAKPVARGPPEPTRRPAGAAPAATAAKAVTDPAKADVTDPAKVLAATGRSQAAWFRILDAYGLEIDHTRRARRLADEHPDLSGWWSQTLTVDFERARGLRVKGQTSKGDFQVSCTKTLSLDVASAWQRVVETPFLRGAQWRAGKTWDAGEAHVEVRRVDPGKVLRWFWSDQHGKSTVTVTFAPRAGRGAPRRTLGQAERTAITITHAGLRSAGAVNRYRTRWKRALDEIARD